MCIRDSIYGAYADGSSHNWLLSGEKRESLSVVARHLIVRRKFFLWTILINHIKHLNIMAIVKPFKGLRTPNQEVCEELALSLIHI